MIGYFLLIITVIIGIYLICAGNKSHNDDVLGVGIVLTIVFSVFLFVASLHLGTKASDAEYFRKNRDYYQELVNSISDDMSPATVAKIISTAEDTNTKIENNRRSCNSEMWGFLFNKRIAEVEPINIPKYKFSVKVEK